MANIEKLTAETQTITAQLEAIKKLAETERAPKQTELKTQIDKINTELHTHLQSLQSKTDAQSANERAKTEALLSTMNTANDKLLQLGAEVQSNTNTVATNEEKKWFKQRWSDLWSDGKRKETAGKVWMAAGAVSGVTWLWNKVSGWFGGGKSESNKKTSRWQELVKWVGITWWSVLAYTGMSKLRDKIKERLPDIFGPELSFEAAFNNVQAELNKVDEKKLGIWVNMSRKETGEWKWILTSYWVETEIDTKNKKIPGMNVNFTAFDHLIHAANLANFCKGSFRWSCKSDAPFNETSLWWDLSVDLAETGEEEFVSGRGFPLGKIIWGLWSAWLLYCTPRWKVAWKALWITWWFAAIAGFTALWHFGLDRNDTLSKICPMIADGTGRKEFRWYLNWLGIWKQGNVDKNGNNTELDNVTPSVLAEDLKALITEIQQTQSNNEKFKEHGNKRMMDVIPDKTNPQKFILKSRRYETIFFYDEKAKTIRIDGLKHTFSNIHEWLRTANLTNKFKGDNVGQCNSDKPFSYWIDFKWKGIYIDNQRFDDRSLSEDAFQKNFPTLFKNKKEYINYLNKIEGWKE